MVLVLLELLEPVMVMVCVPTTKAVGTVIAGKLREPVGAAKPI